MLRTTPGTEWEINVLATILIDLQLLSDVEDTKVSVS